MRARILRRRYGRAHYVPLRGQAQLAIHSYMFGRGAPVALTDMVRHHSFCGVHLSKVMSAAEALKKRGDIDYDGQYLAWRRRR